MPRRERPMIDINRMENSMIDPEFPHGEPEVQNVSDYAPLSAPDRADQIMQQAGSQAADLIEQVCEVAANRVRDMCKEMSELAENYKKDGEEFADQIIQIGKFHSERLNRTAQHMQELVKRMGEEKNRLTSLIETNNVKVEETQA
jgi:hypothetical protein